MPSIKTTPDTEEKIKILSRDSQYDLAWRLLRVPGLGPVMLERILDLRRGGMRLRSLECLGKQTKLLQKAYEYVTF
jgi:hypothetical protein